MPLFARKGRFGARGAEKRGGEDGVVTSDGCFAATLTLGGAWRAFFCQRGKVFTGIEVFCCCVDTWRGAGGRFSVNVAGFFAESGCFAAALTPGGAQGAVFPSTWQGFSLSRAVLLPR